MESQQIGVKKEQDYGNNQSCPIKCFKTFLRHEAWLLNWNSDYVSTEDKLHNYSGKNGREHSYKVNVIMHADVITDPNAMVIEIVCASVTPLTVLCVLENVSITYVAKELVVAGVEIKRGKSMLLCSPGQSF